MTLHGTLRRNYPNRLIFKVEMQYVPPEMILPSEFLIGSTLVAARASVSGPITYQYEPIDGTMLATITPTQPDRLSDTGDKLSPSETAEINRDRWRLLFGSAEVIELHMGPDWDQTWRAYAVLPEPAPLVKPARS